MNQLIIASLLSFYLAFNLGANDIANAMGTSVGSKAVTLKQAMIIAGVLEFAGAVLFGRGVTETLGTKIAHPELFITTPRTLLLGMMAVLISSGLWLQLATALSLPVSSSHAVVGAIAGFTWVATGVDNIDWQAIRTITLIWVLTPIVSASIAGIFYSIIQNYILSPTNSQQRLQEWIPWLSVIVLSVFGAIVLVPLAEPITRFFDQQVGLQIPPHSIAIFTIVLGIIVLTIYSWKQVENTTGQISASPIHNLIEGLFANFQLLSACFVAFAHGANDIGNAIAPLAVISYIDQTQKVPIHGITVPGWVIILGGVGIVSGLGIWGRKVITTIGQHIIPLQPSAGFCAELATATTVLLASRLGLPVSTSHGIIGSIIGVGLVQSPRLINFSTIRGITAAWLITVPISAFISALIFIIIRIV